MLSHGPAAYVLRLLRGAPPIVVHRVKALGVLDHSTHDAIPITIVPRILLDMAPRMSAKDLGRLCHEAWIHHGTTPRHVETCIARNPTKNGIRKLRAAIGADVTLSVLEDRFLELLREHGLPAPRTNVIAHGDRVDCHWPQHGLTVELLSYTFHGSRAAFEADVARRRRSGHLAFTSGDVFERPLQAIAELRAAISAR